MDSTKPDYKIWNDITVARNYLEGVRSAIPLAAEQIDCILRLLALTQSEVHNFLDLGCGNGILGREIVRKYPQARGTFLDMSEAMLTEAKSQIESDKATFILQDFGEKNWLDRVTLLAPFDVIVSGFSIHHQPDNLKQEIYSDIYEILQPGGIFLNLEHVASESRLGETAFDNLFIDALYEYHCQNREEQSRSEIASKYYSRDDKNANILTLVETQCDWLRKIGFIDVDCFMKIFEIALFGGIKPRH
jgi:SAM-dependent methyltransferase